MERNVIIYLRNIIFGISDSLVSTVGLLSGIDVSGTAKNMIVLTGVVYAFVEAFSMAVGSFLSEESVEEYGGSRGSVQPFMGGVVMFISFVIASFIPIAPYLFASAAAALWYSIGFSVVALFIVGLVSAKITKSDLKSRAIKTALLGGAAIIIGVIVGKLVRA